MSELQLVLMIKKILHVVQFQREILFKVSFGSCSVHGDSTGQVGHWVLDLFGSYTKDGSEL